MCFCSVSLVPDESAKHLAGSQPDHKDALDGLKHSSTMDDSMATAGIIKDSNEEYAQVSNILVDDDCDVSLYVWLFVTGRRVCICRRRRPTVERWSTSAI